LLEKRMRGKAGRMFQKERGEGSKSVARRNKQGRRTREGELSSKGND